MNNNNNEYIIILIISTTTGYRLYFAIHRPLHVYKTKANDKNTENTRVLNQSRGYDTTHVLITTVDPTQNHTRNYIPNKT